MKLFSLFSKKKTESKPLVNPGIQYEVPKSLTEYIKSNIFFFSACKSKEDMQKISILLLTDTNEIKPFYKFYQEVQKLHPNCEHDLLEREYNLAIACALLYPKSKEFKADGDRYHWQIREYEGKEFTLSPNDPFWLKFFPPNDWTDNKFNVVQVLKRNYPLSDSNEAIKYMSKKVDPLFQCDFSTNSFPIDRFIQCVNIE